MATAITTRGHLTVAREVSGKTMKTAATAALLAKHAVAMMPPTRSGGEEQNAEADWGHTSSKIGRPGINEKKVTKRRLPARGNGAL